MRIARPIVVMALAAGLARPAAAQPAVPIDPVPAAPPMRSPSVMSPPPQALRAPGGAVATPAAPPPPPFVRPGNVIGTGQSLPLSDKASNITPGDTASSIAPRLPSPALDEDAPPAAFLRAARAALAAGRTGEAQEALERAESRALDRAVRPSQASRPSGQALVARIAEARGALSAADRPRAMAMIEGALRDAEAAR